MTYGRCGLESPYNMTSDIKHRTRMLITHILCEIIYYFYCHQDCMIFICAKATMTTYRIW